MTTYRHPKTPNYKKSARIITKREPPEFAWFDPLPRPPKWRFMHVATFVLKAQWGITKHTFQTTLNDPVWPIRVFSMVWCTGSCSLISPPRGISSSLPTVVKKQREDQHLTPRHHFLCCSLCDVTTFFFCSIATSKPPNARFFRVAETLVKPMNIYNNDTFVTSQNTKLLQSSKGL